MNLNIYKELLLVIMGPLVQILFLLFMSYLYKINLINSLTYNKIYTINKLLLTFNLLPIIPLDGGKILNNILDLILPYKMSHKLTLIISFISLPLLFLIDNKLLVLVLFIYLIVNLIEEVNIHKVKLELLLLERKYKNYKFKKCIYINNINKV